MQRASFKLKGSLYLCFFILFLLLVACDVTEKNLPDNTANLKATSSKNYTTSLTWDAQSASKVILERKAEGGEFATIADVTSQTSFEDFPVFDDLNYTYRLTDGTNPLGEASLKVAAVTASPLTVTLTPEASPVTQTIGAAGGSITATSANGVVYTLSIPADALLSNKEITLTPISQVGNLPLSGGLLSAVKIEPEGLEFYGYATLTTTLKQGAPANTSVIGFKSSNTGSEFHLYPLSKPATAALIDLTALQAQQDDDELVPITRVDETGTYGTGAGTSQDVKKQIQDHPPTDNSSQNQQQSAADDDELVPLIPGYVTASAWDVRLQNKEINRPSNQTQSIFKEYRQWLEYLREHGLEATFDTKIKAHSKRISDRINNRFDELATKCQAGDSTVRSEMQALISWSSKYPALVQNLGSGWFTTAKEKVKNCGAAQFTLQGELPTGYIGPADALDHVVYGEFSFIGSDSFTAQLNLAISDAIIEGQLESFQNATTQYTAQPADPNCTDVIHGEPEVLTLDGLFAYDGILTLKGTEAIPGGDDYLIYPNGCILEESDQPSTINISIAFGVDLFGLAVGESVTVDELSNINQNPWELTITRDN